MINYCIKDIFKAPIDVLAHGCNCFNTFGGGLALKVKENFPEVYDADLKTIKGDRKKLGSLSMASITKPNIPTQIKFVFNLYTQFSFGTDKRYLNYEAIYKSLEELHKNITGNKLVIGMPYLMGCGLAGGHWPIVHEMIKFIFCSPIRQVYICVHPDIRNDYYAVKNHLNLDQ